MHPASPRALPASSQRPRRLPPKALSPQISRGAARSDLAARFRRAGIESADLDARLLVCATCRVDHPALTRDPDVPLGAAASMLSAYLDRRLAHEPVSRILGHREFWGLRFAIAPSVLDPRPETEGLVGSVLDAIGGRRETPLKILDLGTGSGVILCALLHELPAAGGVGVDHSPSACRQAKANVVRLGLDARGAIVCGSWADPVRASFDIVVSNPPYIRRAELDQLAPEVRCFDPIEALDGGADGLDAYRTIVAQLPLLAAPGGVAAFECGFDQAQQIAGFMRGAGFEGVMSYKDLAGHERVVLGVRRP